MDNTLFQRIGGKEAVIKAVDIIYKKIINDELLKDFFNKTDIHRLKAKKKMFLTIAFGGPIKYSGKDVATAHNSAVNYGLNGDHFDRYMVHLESTLNELNIEKEDIRAITQKVASYKKDVLSGESHPPLRREISVYSFQEYIEVTSQFEENVLFRGQANVEWPLVPSIARLSSANDSSYLQKLGGWSKLEQDIMMRFMRHASPLLHKEPHNYIEWLVLAQHHGLPTRLLDWTQNSLIALYFALSTENENESVIWTIDPKYVYSINIDLKNLEQLQVYFPTNIDPKLVSQKGCFTLQPLPKDSKSFVPLQDDTDTLSLGVHSMSRITIPADNVIKNQMLYQLANCGIDETFIYPDLYGLSRQIKRDIAKSIMRF
jgi:truncated hemoglobin YjbI